MHNKSITPPRYSHDILRDCHDGIFPRNAQAIMFEGTLIIPILSRNAKNPESWVWKH